MPGGPYASIEAVEQSFLATPLTLADAAGQLIALAATGDLGFQIRAGIGLAYIVQNNPRTGGSPSGEGGGSSGGPFQGGLELLGILNAAFPTGTTPPAYAYGLLAGIIAAPSSNIVSDAQAKLSALVGHDAAQAVLAIPALAAGFVAADNNHKYAPAAEIANLLNSVPLGVADLARELGGFVSGGSVAATTAIDILGRVGILYGDPLGYVAFAAAAGDVAAGVLALVQAQQIGATAAIDALVASAQSLAQQASGGGGPGAVKYLLAIAGAEPTLFQVAGARLAALVDATGAGPAGLAGAQSAVTSVTAALQSGQITAPEAVSLLAAVASAAGTPSAPSSDPLQAAGTAIRVLVANGTLTATAAATAIQDAITGFGLTPDAGVTVLLGIGANGVYQLSGNMFQYVGNNDLIAAAGDALAILLDANPSLTSASLAADLARALRADASALTLKVFAHAALESSDAGMHAKIGAALAQAVAAGIFDVESQSLTALKALTSIGDRVVASGGVQPHGAEAIAILIGFAGATTTAANEILVGRQVARVFGADGSLVTADGVAAIVDAIAAQALTGAQATVMLAGLATGSNAAGQLAAWPALASLLASDPANLAVLDAAIGEAGSPLGFAESYTLLVNLQALSAGAAADAINAEAVSLATRSSAGADHATATLLAAVETAGRALFGIEKLAVQARVAAAASEQIAAFVDQGLITPAEVVAELMTALGNATVSAVRAVAALANLQAAGFDAGLVIDALLALIEDGRISASALVDALTDLQVPGASSALQAALASELEAVLLTPENLAATAGLGSDAQVLHAASAIAELYVIETIAAEVVLDGLAGRIEAGNLTAMQAAQLLIYVYSEGGLVATAAKDILISLATVIPSGHSVPDVSLSTILSRIEPTITAGHLSASEAVDLLEALFVVNAGAVRNALASLIVHGHVTVAALDAEVTAGDITALDAIQILGTVISQSSGSVRADALAEVAALAGTDPGLGQAALTIFVNLAASTDPDTRDIGYLGIEALAPVPGLGQAAFVALVPLLDASNIFVKAEAQAELISLLSDGRLITSEAITALGTQLTTGSPVITHAQVLDTLVELSHIAASQADIYAYLKQIVVNGTGGLTAAEVIIALADDLQGRLGESGAAAVEIIDLATFVGFTPSQLADVIVQASLSSAEKAALLAEIGGLTGSTLEYGNIIALRLLPLSSLGEVMGPGLNQLSPQGAVEIVLGTYANLARPVAIAALDALLQAGKLSATDVAYALTHLAATAQMPAPQAIETLVDIAYGSSSPALVSAAALAIADAITGGTASSTGTLTTSAVLAGLNGAVADQFVMPIQAFALIEKALLARLAQVDSYNLTGPAFAQATATLLTAVNDELTYLTSQGLSAHDVVTALALASAGTTASQLAAIGAQIVTIGSAALLPAEIMADIVAATAGPTGLSFAQAASILVSTGIAGDEALQIEAGRAIGELYLDGSLSVTEVAAAIDGPTYAGIVSGAQGLALTLGVIAVGGSDAVGAIISHLRVLLTAPVLASEITDAVVADIMTAIQAIDAAAAVSISWGEVATTIAIAKAVIASGEMTPADAVAALGPHAGEGFFPVSAALEAVMAIAAGETAANALALGVTLGEWLAGGWLTEIELSAGLSLAINGDLHGHSPVITIDEAIRILLGVASDTSPAAIAAGVPAIGNRLLDDFVDAGNVAGLIAAIDAAVVAGTLTAAAAVSQLLGLADGLGAASNVAIAAELVSLVTDGHLGITPANGFFLIESALKLAVGAGTLDGGKAVFLGALALESPVDFVNPGSLVGYLVDGGMVTPSAAVAQLIAATQADPQAFPTTAAATLLAGFANNASSRPELAAASVAGLETLMESGSLIPNFFVANAKLLVDILDVVDAKLATAPTPTLEALQDSLYTTLLSLPDATVIAGVDAAMASGLVTPAHGLDILVELTSRGGSSLDAAVVAKLASLVQSQTVTIAEVANAFSSAEHGLVLLAGLINPAAPASPLTAVLARVLSDTLTSGTAAGNAATAIADAIADGTAHALTAAQAVHVLTNFGQLGRADVTHAGAVALAGLVSAGTVTQADALLGAERALLSAPIGAAQLGEAALIASFLGARGLDAAGIVQAIGNSDVSVDAVRVMALLTATQDPAYQDPSAPVIGDAAIAQGLLALVAPPAQTLGQVLTRFTAVELAGVNDTVDVLLAVASVGTIAQQVAAGQATAALSSSIGSATLAALVGSLTAARQVDFILGLSIGDQVLASDIAVRLDLQTSAHNLAANVIAALQAGAVTQQVALGFLTGFANAITTGSPAGSADYLNLAFLITRVAINETGLLGAPADAIAGMIDRGLIGPDQMLAGIDAGIAGQTLTLAQAAALLLNTLPINPTTDIAIATKLLTLLAGSDIFTAIDAAVDNGHIGFGEGIRLSALVAGLNSAYVSAAAAEIIALILPNGAPSAAVFEAIAAVKDLGDAAFPNIPTAIASIIRALVATGEITGTEAVDNLLTAGSTLSPDDLLLTFIKLGVSIEPSISAAAAAAYRDDGSALANAVAAGLVDGVQAAKFAAFVLANNSNPSISFTLTMSLGSQLASFVGPSVSITDILNAIALVGTADVDLQLFAAIVTANPNFDRAALLATQGLITAGTFTLDHALAEWGLLLQQGNVQPVGRLLFELAASTLSDSAVLAAVSHVDQGRIAREAIIPDLQAARDTGGNAAQIEAMVFNIAGAPNLAINVQAGAVFSYRTLGHFLAAPLAALNDPTAAAAAIAELIAVADAALAAGRLSASKLATLLTSFATQDGPGPYAVLAAATELSALLSSGRLNTTELASVMTGFARDSGDPTAKLVHLLAEMSGPVPESAVALVSALVNGGFITGEAAADAVHELSGTTPAGVAAGLALVPAVAEEFLLRLALDGSGSIRDAAFAQVVDDIASGSAAVGNGIAGALQTGWLTPLEALQVTARLLAAETADPGGLFGAWAVSHVAGLVTDAHLTATEGAAIFLRALSGAGTIGHGEILDVLLALPNGIDAIHDALAADPTLAAPAIDALLSIADSPRFGGATTGAAIAEVLSILHEGLLSPVQLAAHGSASGHFETLRFAVLTDAPDDAAKAAFTVDYVSRFRTPNDHLLADSWLSGSDAQVGYDYFRVLKGLVGVADAAADLTAFGTARGVSVDEALLNLARILAPGNLDLASQVRAFVIDRIESGALELDLAQHLQTSGNQLTVQEALTRFFPATDHYTHGRDTYIDQFLAEAHILAQINAGDTVDVSDFHPGSTITVGPSLSYYLPPPLGRLSFGVELALDAVIDKPGISATAKAEAQAELGRLLISGTAAAGAVDFATDRSQANHYRVDLDLVLSLLDGLADQVRTPDSDSDPTLERQIALAQLFVNDRAAVGRMNGSREVQSDLRGQLLAAEHVDDVLAGLGALLSLPNSGNSRELITIATQDYMTHGYLPAHAQEMADDLARAAGAETGGDKSVSDNIYAILEGGYGKTQGSKSVLGVIHDDIATDPTSVEGYARFGAALAVGKGGEGIGESLFGLGGLKLTAAALGSKMALYALAQSPVKDFLGEGLTETLRGAFTITGATASLISGILFDSSQKAVDNAKLAGPNLIEFGLAVRDGNIDKILSSSGQLVKDYYKITTGFDLNVAQDLAVSLGYLLGDLFTGNTDALHADVVRLGDDFVELFRGNVYVGILSEHLLAYSSTINSALKELGSGLQIVGDDIVDGLVYLTELDDDIEDFFTNLFGIDGYIEGATVFADRNLNGVQDVGETSATINPGGGYHLVNPIGPILLTGGIDTATKLPFTGTLKAPAGSTVLTPLTTLITNLAAPGDAKPVGAEATVSTALGIASAIDLLSFNPIAGTLAGDAGARQVLAAGSMVLNTITLLQAAGATDAASLIASKISSGASFDLTNPATLLNLAVDAGLGAASDAVAKLAGASNTLVSDAVSSLSDPSAFLRMVFAISIDTQGAASDALRAAMGDAGALDAAVAAHTGQALDKAVVGNLADVGSLDPSAAFHLFGEFVTSATSGLGQIFELYTGLLQRAPDPLGYEFWIDAMHDGMSLAEIAARFIASPEFSATAGPVQGKSDADFVKDLYRVVLGRDPDQAGSDFWTGELSAGASRGQVAGAFALSAEHVAHDATALSAGIFAPDPVASDMARLYYAVLDRAPDAQGLAFWTEAVRGGMSEARVANEFLLSTEYATKLGAPGDAEFLLRLYDGALGRAPDPEGSRTWLAELSRGTSREQVALGIAESQEAKNFHLNNIELGWHLM